MLFWSPYHIHLDQSITPKQTPSRPMLVHLNEAFQQEIDKVLKVRVLKPVHEATHLGQQFCTFGGKGQSWQFKTLDLLQPPQSKQSGHEGTIPL